MQIIPYNDSRLQYLGRWNDTGTGKWTAWISGQVLFKVSGTNFVEVNMDIIDTTTTAVTIINANIDNAAPTPSDIFATTAAEIFTGNRTVSIPIPDTGEHTVIIHTIQSYIYAYTGVSRMTIKELHIDNNGVLSLWPQSNSIYIQCVGDSWMGRSNDWPRLMDRLFYKLYPMGIDGFTAADSNAYYNYDYNGQLNITDPIVDVVIVSFGVNDYIAGITQASFESSLSNLVDKIRAKQPTAPIYLIRCVDNRYLTPSSNNYGKYGINMANIAAIKTNVKYIDTTSLDSIITWAGDNTHLDSTGKQLLADFIGNYLLVDLGVTSTSMGYILD